MITTEANKNLVALTADIVSAHVAHNSVAVADLSTLIAKVHAALAGLGTPAEPVAAAPQQPAVSVRTSVKSDYLVCLEDGKRLTMLKRHLMTDHQMTPADYRTKWKLPADYPMVASDYAAKRRTLALSFGLGKGRTPEAAAVEQPVDAAPPASPPPAEASPAKARTRKPRSKLAVDES